MYRDPPYTVDALIVNDDRIVVVERGHPPFAGQLALPGGHVDAGEAPEDAIIREAKEETGLDVEIIAELGDYSTEITDTRYDPDHFEHTAYICTTDQHELTADDDAAAAYWRRFDDLPDKLAFGHERLINDYLKDWYDGAPR